jgi:hypothetical protein
MTYCVQRDMILLERQSCSPIRSSDLSSALIAFLIQVLVDSLVDNGADYGKRRPRLKCTLHGKASMLSRLR